MQGEIVAFPKVHRGLRADRLTVCLEPDLRALVEARALAEGHTASAFVRKVLSDFLKGMGGQK